MLTSPFSSHFYVRMTAHLAPLAIAANMTQGLTTRLDHVLLGLGNLYRIYLDENLDSNVQSCIHTSLEKRWNKADQDVFITAVFLNPYIRHRLFNSNERQLAFIGLYNCIRRLFTRVFPHTKIDMMDLYESVEDYYSGVKEFHPVYMNLAEMEAIYRNEVCAKTYFIPKQD